MQGYGMIKNEIQVVKKKGVHYVVGNDGALLKFKPWLGDAASFLYDFIMEKSIFPRKFGGDMDRHYAILGKELRGVRGKRVLELATGTGTDISPGLLRKAVERFRDAGFTSAEFYVTGADGLPFDDNCFDVVLCILSLNFFNDIQKVFRELKRVAAPGALLLCSVPVPERNTVRGRIRGTLYSEDELRGICEGHGLSYEAIPAENGTLLYFRARMPGPEN